MERESFLHRKFNYAEWLPHFIKVFADRTKLFLIILVEWCYSSQLITSFL